MGMKGLRVECGDYFMSVVRKKDGSEIGRVNWYSRSKTPLSEGYPVCVVTRLGYVTEVAEFTKHACGTMPDDEVVKLVLVASELNEKRCRSLIDENMKHLAAIEANICDLRLGSEPDDA